jgi:hypothetical protein
MFYIFRLKDHLVGGELVSGKKMCIWIGLHTTGKHCFGYKAGFSSSHSEALASSQS